MNDSATSPSRALRYVTCVAIAAAALLGFLVLLDDWRTPPGASESPPAVALPTDTPLELSRRLTPLDAAGDPPTLVVTSTPSLVGPLLGFGLALAAGLLIGGLMTRARARREAGAGQDELSIAQQAIAAHLAETGVSATYPVEPGVAAGPEPEPHDVAPPPESPAPAIAAALPHEPDAPPLDEALRARDEVIASLEAIVADNREKWGEYENERDALIGKIARLEAELESANAIIDDMQTTTRRRTAIEADREAFAAQILERA